MRERVMWVSRNVLEKVQPLTQGYWEGGEHLYAEILSNHAYAERFELETDPSRKQPIPYVVVLSEYGIFCMARKKAQTEARLHGKLSIGVGGHISESEDDGKTDALVSGMWRELHEELHIIDAKQCAFRGFLNDDSNEVGQVHIGLVYTIDVTPDQVAVRETEKMEGFWVTLDELHMSSERLESWSRLLLPHLPAWIESRSS